MSSASQSKQRVPDFMENKQRPSHGMIIVLLFPIVTLVGGYAFVNHLRVGIADNYDRYREFWGGNPSEVFSHWLDMILMSGGAAVMAWLTSAEAFFRRGGHWAWCQVIHGCLASLLILSGVTAVVLDGSHGEGTVLIAYSLLFLPILASSYYLLRRFAAKWDWNPTKVVLLCVGFVLIHLVAQLFFEPSGTGAPNGLVLLVWLGSVGCALLWSVVRGIHTGFLKRIVTRGIGIIRRPTVWGSSILIGLAIGIPITLHAQRTQRTHQEMAFAWLDDLEAKLTDGFIEEIKRDHTPSKADSNSKIPLSTAAHSVLTDARIKGDNELRIYVPVNEQDYIFLWGNDHIQYCDIRQLVRENTEEMDQGFIDTLIDHGGTYQTGLFSILWSPYMAGRVIKDKDGRVKAICVINAP